MSDVLNYWESRYFNDYIRHSEQNLIISIDFIKQLKKNAIFLTYLNKSKSLIEIGCGTGELCYLIHKNFPNIQNIIGIDISTYAIKYANEHYRNLTLQFKSIDILNENIYDFFDISISSNTLEHFKDPHSIIEKMLSFSQNVIILVPYMQPCNENYEGEGGAGHVFTFNEKTFDKYNIVDYFIFKTNGWTYSSKGEDPLQLAVLFTKRPTVR